MSHVALARFEAIVRDARAYLKESLVDQLRGTLAATPR